ncbi:MAG: Fe-S cluster assembly protein SufD [Mariprofundaceae bacterium]|nr:Fe-S cluster assembly protein SufD [Mariprofundaceae bacterium]
MKEQYQQYFDQHGQQDMWRKEALVSFGSLGIPDTSQEDWRYTDFRVLKRHVFPVAMQKKSIDLNQFCLPSCDATRLVFVDGFFKPELSDDLPVGLQVVPSVFQDTDHLRDGIEALNVALCTAALDVVLSASVEKAIHCLFISASPDVGNYTQSRLVLAEGVHAEVVDMHIGMPNVRSFVNHQSHVKLGRNAVLQHYSLQYLQNKALYRHLMTVTQQEKSQFFSHAIGLGAAMARTDIVVELQGEEASCTLNGLYLTQSRQHMDYHTTVHHRVPNCESHEYYKGILMDRSRAVFNGKVVVHPYAQKTEAHQQNRNLLLSKKSEIDTKPELEIYADDVSCSHGATVGQIDDNQLFYLRSRGLSEEQAKKILTFSFAAELLNHMTDPVLQEHARQRLLQILPGDELSSELQEMS